MALLSLESGLPTRVGDSSDNRFSEKLYVGNINSNDSIDVGGTSIKTDRITMNANAGDIGTPAAGDLWYNATSGRLKYYHGGVTIEMLDSGGGTMGGHLLFSPTNNYDIGASGATKPRTGYFGTSVGAGNTFVKTDRLSIPGAVGDISPSAGGDLWYNTTSQVFKFYDASGLGATRTIAHSGTSLGTDLSGTISAPTVAKLRGYSLESGAPLAGEHLTYNGSTQLEYVRNCWDLIAETDGGSSGSQISIGSLAGDTHEMYMLVMWGYFNTGGANDYVWIQFNGDTNANYVWSRHDQGWDSAGGTSHGVSNANGVTGCRILDTDKNKNAYFQLIAYIDAKINTANHYRTVSVKTNWVATDGNTAYDQSYVGAYKVGNTQITSMLLKFGASTNKTFTGNLRLYGLRKY